MANLPQGSVNGPSAGVRQRVHWLRGLVVPAGAANSELAAAGVVNTQVWLDQSFWRPAAFWAFCAGLLASGALRQVDSLSLTALTVLALLVDPLWGGIWRLSGGRQALLLPTARREEARMWLPYLQANSPAARLLGGDHNDVWSSALRIGAPVVVLALLVSAVLGTAAVAFTLAVLLLAALGWTIRRTSGFNSPLLAALIAIGLPWALTVQQVSSRQGGQDPRWAAQVVLIGLWVLHQWGALRTSGQRDWVGLALMAVAQLGMAGLLIAAQAPLWLVPLALLFLPTWVLAAQGGSLRRLRVVWLLAMLASAAGLGQVIGP